MKVKQKLSIQYVRAQLNILSLVNPRKAAIKAFRLFCTPLRRDDDEAPAIFGQGERLSFKLEGHAVRGHRWLPDPDLLRPGAQPVRKVLIVHGFESSSQAFDAYIDAFLTKGYEVVAFDAPAHGRSGGRRILLTDYVKMLRQIAQNYGPFQSWMGHSLGGLALTLALEDEQHDTSARVVLVAPAVETTSAVNAFTRTLRLSPDVVREMNDYVKEIGGHPFSWYSLRRSLGQVQADVLYFQDEEDRITPMSEALTVQRDAHPHVHFVFTKGLGHRRIYKDPEILGRIVGFL